MPNEIKPEHVPKEALFAFGEALYTNASSDAEAIAAAINAWPGIKLENLCCWVMDGPDLPYVEEAASIILPLPQENSDDQ